MEHNIKPGQLYKHYRGDTYKILTLAKYSETGDWLVVYERMTDFVHSSEWKIRARPLELFTGKVDIEGKEIPRFEFISEE